MSASASSVGVDVPAGVSVDGGVSAANPASSSAGLKTCSACTRSLHQSAFSVTQAKAPAAKRKCMECVVTGKSAPAADAPAASAAASLVDLGASAPKKKSKATTPGAIARERAAARDAASLANSKKLAASSSSSSSSSSSASKLVSSANALLAESLSPEATKGSKLKAKAAAGRAAKAAAQAAGKGGDSIFNAPRKSADMSGKAALLDDDEEWFLPAAEMALEEVFRRFDTINCAKAAKAGVTVLSAAAREATPRDKLAWTLADIQSFARAANGAEFGTEELVEIQENLEHDDEGRLTCQGFLDFYHLQTTSHPDETWKDLKKLGYNDQLQYVEPAAKA